MIQEQNSIDVVKINAKRATLDENLSSAAAAKERVDSSNWDDEMRISRKMEDIEKYSLPPFSPARKDTNKLLRLLHQYHDIAGRLQLVGPDTKNANGVNWQISFNTHSVSAENGISFEIKHSIKVLNRISRNYYLPSL